MIKAVLKLRLLWWNRWRIGKDRCQTLFPHCRLIKRPDHTVVFTTEASHTQCMIETVDKQRLLYRQAVNMLLFYSDSRETINPIKASCNSTLSTLHRNGRNKSESKRVFLWYFPDRKPVHENWMWHKMSSRARLRWSFTTAMVITALKWTLE